MEKCLTAKTAGRETKKDIDHFNAGFKRFHQQYFDPRKQQNAPPRQGQKPKVLVVGCNNSWGEPGNITKCAPGELLVVRNTPNLIHPCEQENQHHKVISALEYAVSHMEVEHIIILGHSGCGGIGALINGLTNGRAAEFIALWAKIAGRDMKQAKKMISNKALYKHCRACEQTAIAASMENLLSYSWISNRVESGSLRLHGWYFDIIIGRLFSYDSQAASFEPFG